jgi:hypothetical protein
MAGTVIKLKRGLADAWISVNPTLEEGEIGIEITESLDDGPPTHKIKIGDGIHAWSVLDYYSASWEDIVGKPELASLLHASRHGVSGADPITIARSQVADLDYALGLKAPLNSPSFTGTPQAPTALPDTDDDRIATTKFAKKEADDAYEKAILRENHEGEMSADYLIDGVETNKVVFTSQERSKLASIPAGLAAQVPSNWNATTGVAAILNKPGLATSTVPGLMSAAQWVKLEALSVSSNSDWAVTDPTNPAFIENKPTDATQSTSGFLSSTDKVKLDGIANGAEVNVQANWNATTGDALILNKPTDATQSTSGFLSSTDKTKLDGIEPGAEVNVQANWNATTGDAQILNKPTIGTLADKNITYATTAPSSPNLYDRWVDTASMVEYVWYSDAWVSLDPEQILEIASIEEAQAGTDNEKLMTPLRTAEAIAASPAVNVQADWNATSGDAQILNKPDIGETRWPQAIRLVGDSVGDLVLPLIELSDGRPRYEGVGIDGYPLRVRKLRVVGGDPGSNRFSMQMNEDGLWNTVAHREFSTDGLLGEYIVVGGGSIAIAEHGVLAAIPAGIPPYELKTASFAAEAGKAYACDTQTEMVEVFPSVSYESQSGALVFSGTAQGQATGILCYWGGATTEENPVIITTDTAEQLTFYVWSSMTVGEFVAWWAENGSEITLVSLLEGADPNGTAGWGPWDFGYAMDETAGEGYDAGGTPEVAIPFSVTLPETPSVGDVVSFMDARGNFDVSPLTLLRNGNLIEGVEEDFPNDLSGVFFCMVFVGGETGWRVLLSGAKPLIIAAPTLTGTQEFTVSSGTWTGSPSSFAYQWQISDDGETSWADIEGATSSSYLALSGQGDKFIRCGVIATNNFGSSTEVFTTSSVVVISPLVFPSSGLLAAWPLSNSGADLLGGDALTLPVGGSFVSGAFHAALAADVININGKTGAKTIAFWTWFAETPPYHLFAVPIILSLTISDLSARIGESGNFETFDMAGGWGGTLPEGLFGTVSPSAPFHVAITDEGESPSHTNKIYLNGVEVASAAENLAAGGLCGGSIYEQLAVRLRGVFVWDRALTAPEIQALAAGATYEP